MTDAERAAFRAGAEAMKKAAEAAHLKAIRSAFNEGWREGGREYTSSNGGKPWSDSDSAKYGTHAIAALPIPEPEEGK